MRTVRWITSALALAAIVPTVGAAQQNRLFDNAWFWGAKFGIMSFDTGVQTKAAPLIGGEWLITRSRAGLYVSVEQAFFNSTGAAFDNTGQAFAVQLKDMRRYTAAALAFPVSWGSIRPYAGVGFSLNVIQHASIDGSQVSDPNSVPVLEQQLADEKDRISFILMGGTQIQYRRFSVFGQATYMPARQNFFFTGRSTDLIEGGIRYNVGSSIDRP